VGLAQRRGSGRHRAAIGDIELKQLCPREALPAQLRHGFLAPGRIAAADVDRARGRQVAAEVPRDVVADPFIRTRHHSNLGHV